MDATAEIAKAYKPHAINACQIEPGDLITLDHFYGIVEVESIEPIDSGIVGYDAPWARTYRMRVRVQNVVPRLSGQTYTVARYGGEAMTRWEWES